MKYSKLVLIVTLMLGGGVSCGSSEQVFFADGTQTQLEHWDGRWLVINYWAEWCKPCRHEIPELNELYAKRAAHGVVVLGVNWDGFSDEKLSTMITNMDIKFPTLIVDPYQKWGYKRPEQLPQTVLINPEREVTKILVGPQTVETILAYIPDHK